jgi:hypothetical protein
MKIFLVTALILMGAVSYAEDIKTSKGEVLKKAEVISHDPSGCYISYYDTNKKEEVLKHFAFIDLPKQIQKKYNYNPEKAKKYDSQVEKLFAEHAKTLKVKEAKLEVEKEKKLAAEKKALRKSKAEEKAYQAAAKALKAKGIKVQLKVTATYTHGIIAWASYDDPESTRRTVIGKICVIGLDISQGAMWTGIIYPLDRSIADGSDLATKEVGLATYATPLALAVKLEKR